VGYPLGCHGVHRRRADPARQAGDHGRLRHQGRQDRQALRAWRGDRGRAARGTHPDLDRRDGRTDQRDGSQLLGDQPDLHDGELGCSRKHDPDAPDRRHARPGGQPEGRDHRPPDQVELPRRPDRAGVLHLHPRRPQGAGRHRTAYRRLGLPDPSPGRRLAGRHHPRGGLRYRTWSHQGDRSRGRDRGAASGEGAGYQRGRP